MEIYSKEHIDKFMNKINTKKLTIFGLSYCERSPLLYLNL